MKELLTRAFGDIKFVNFIYEDKKGVNPTFYTILIEIPYHASMQENIARKKKIYMVSNIACKVPT